jgi:hypothetical protein
VAEEAAMGFGAFPIAEPSYTTVLEKDKGESVRAEMDMRLKSF